MKNREPQAKMMIATSLGTDILIGSNRPTIRLLVRNRTINKDGNSTFDLAIPYNLNL